MLSMIEVGIECLEKELKKTILSLSFKHGLITFIKVIALLYKRNKNFSNQKEFIDKFFDDLNKPIENTPK